MNQANSQQVPLDELLKIAILFLFGAIIFGAVINLVIFPIAWVYWRLYKWDKYCFALSLLIIPMGWMVISKWYGPPLEVFRYIGEWLAHLIVDPLYNKSFSPKWANFLFKYIKMSWSWSPIAACVVAYQILKHTKILENFKFNKSKPIIKKSIFEKHRDRTDRVLIGVDTETKQPVFLEK